jgi:hypothetical protein
MICASIAIAATGAPPSPARRSAPMAKMEPTPNPVTASVNGPSRNVTLNARSAMSPAGAPPSCGGLLMAAWNSNPPAITPTGTMATHSPCNALLTAKPPSVASGGKCSHAAGRVARIATPQASGGFARPETSKPTSASIGRAWISRIIARPCRFAARRATYGGSNAALLAFCPPPGVSLRGAGVPPMTRIARLIFAEDGEQDEADRQTASLAGLAVALLLVAVGLFLIRTLHEKTAVEDCLLAGSRNCDAVLTAIR